MILHLKSLDFEIAFFERIVTAAPDYVDALIALAEAYTKKGFYEKGLLIDIRLSKLKKNDPVIFYNLACSYALLRKTQEAVKALSKAIRLGYADFNHIRRDRDLKNLHSDPRFQKLISTQQEKSCN